MLAYATLGFEPNAACTRGKVLIWDFSLMTDLFAAQRHKWRVERRVFTPALFCAERL